MTENDCIFSLVTLNLPKKLTMLQKFQFWFYIYDDVVLTTAITVEFRTYIEM